MSAVIVSLPQNRIIFSQRGLDLQTEMIEESRQESLLSSPQRQANSSLTAAEKQA